MGELSQRIGKKLEGYGNLLFSNMGWDTLAQDLQIECTRHTHKSKKDKEKNTHGIDILQGYFNPFTNRKEATIIECKNHEWKDFIPSNINTWLEELVNTIECASSSSKVSPFLGDYVLTNGILLFNSSDNKYDYVKSQKTLSKIVIPKRRSSMMLYLADPCKLDKWASLNKKINEIKEKKDNENFEIIYPSISGSKWNKRFIITPDYLFSDFVIGMYTKNTLHYKNPEKVDVKVIFSFDKINEDSILYMQDMINKLQLEARNERPQEIEVYFYPESTIDIEFVSENLERILNGKGEINVGYMENRHLSPVDNGRGVD